MEISKKKQFIGKSHGNYKTLNENWNKFENKTDYIKFTKKWIKESYKILKPNGTITVWGDRISIFDIQPILSKYFPKFLDIITWIKHDAPPNITRRGLAPSTEFCLIYCKNNSNWTFNHDDIKKYNNGKQMRNYINIQRTMPKNKRIGHPAQKKIETQLLLIEMLTNKNEIIFDPFTGNGTIPFACIQTNRNFIACENNKEYYNIAQKRIDSIRPKNI